MGSSPRPLPAVVASMLVVVALAGTVALPGPPSSGSPRRLVAPGRRPLARPAAPVHAARRCRRPGRLPLLPARAAPDTGRVRHLGAHPPGAAGHRPPRDPV